ncbi:hypothetical protein Tco_1333264, partial [Tanacetum coccineum]
SGLGADEGTGFIPEVPDVPTYNSDDELISWKSSDKEDDDEVSMSKDDYENADDDQINDNADNEVDDDQDDDNEQTESDNDDYDLVHPKLIQGTQVTEDTHVIITDATPEGQQQCSSVSSGFISNMLNPNPDTGIDSILNLKTASTSLVDVPVSTNVEMPPSSITPLPPPPFIQPQQQTPIPTPIIVPSTSLQNLLTFGSLFKFKDKVKALEDDFSEFKQTNQFASAVTSIPDIVDTYLANKMNKAVKTAV